jgi:hypothetical protein
MAYFYNSHIKFVLYDRKNVITSKVHYESILIL